MNGTDFRVFFEDYARDKLALHLGVKKESIKHWSKELPLYPYDLEFDGIKYDVKTSNPVIDTKNHNFMWDFSLRKYKSGIRGGQHGECDFYVLVAMKNGIPRDVYLVPNEVSPTNHIRISLSGNSKYNKYLIYTTKIIKKKVVKVATKPFDPNWWKIPKERQKMINKLLGK